MTLAPGDPQDGHDALPGSERRRRRLPLRVWLIGLFAAALLVVTAGSGLRTWWADRLRDLTGGAWAVDYVVGVAVGLLPLVGVALGSLHSRGHRRVLRMFALGVAGFCLTYLLSPSAARIATDSHAAHAFNDRVPGYLPGILTAEGVWLLALALAWWRLRQWRRSRAGRITRVEFRR